jgi:hypothetical protein
VRMGDQSHKIKARAEISIQVAKKENVNLD